MLRLVIGGFLFVHYAQLLPYADVLFSDGGMLSSPGHNPFPVPSFLRDAVAARVLVTVLLAAAACYAAGVAGRTMGVVLGLGSMLLWQRNMLTLNPSLPFFGFWFLAQLFTDARGHVPRDVRATLWTVFSVAYSYSGWTKLVSPSWLTGEAVGTMLRGPIGLDNPLARWFAGLPDPVLAMSTWSVVVLELSAVPLALSGRLRPWVWAAILAMHAGLLVLVDLREISWGMIVVHFVLFDPEWVSALRPTARGAKSSSGGTPPR